MLGLGILLAVAAILLLVVTTRLFSLESRIRDLEDGFRILEREQRDMAATLSRAGAPPPTVRVASPPPEAAPPAPAPPPPPVPLPAPFPGTPAMPAPEITQPPVAEARPSLLHPLPEPESVPAPSSRTREEWEALIGGKLLNRIGALALIIGVGFFLKHAIDNNWIDEVARVLIGAAVGFACLFGADRARTGGYQIFSQGLVGAGLAILYLSVYACFNFYQLVSLPVAFVLMGAVTAIAFLEAFRNDSLAVSILACMGGLLTPVMLSTPEPNEVGLFAYLIALNLGIVIILLRKPSWVALEPLSLAGTYTLFFSWFSAYYNVEHTLPALVFLILFWALYHGPDLFRVLSGQPLLQDFHRLMGWFHAWLAFAALYGICIRHGDSPTALASTVAAALYIASALLVVRRRPDAHGAVIQYALSGSAFLACAVALQFEGFTIVYLWTAEALVLVWLGAHYHRRFLWIVGVALFGVTALTLLTVEGSLFALSFEDYRPVLSARALAYVLLAAAACASAQFIRTATPYGSTLPVDTLHCGWIFLVLMLLTIETNDLFRSWMVTAGELETATLDFTRFMVMAMIWALYGLILVWLARRIEIPPVVFSGVAVTFIAACLLGIRGIAFEPLAAFTPALNIRACAILFVAAGLFLEGRWLRDSRVRSTWLPELREATMILGVALLLVLFTGETRDAFEQAMPAQTGTAVEGSIETLTQSERMAEAERLENLKQLSLSGVWLLFSIAVMAFGIWRRTRVLRLMAMVLFGVTILKIFIYDLSFLDTLYRIFSFVALGVILLAVSYLYQRYRPIIVGPSDKESA
jgi:uncharacterized membrane protein